VAKLRGDDGFGGHPLDLAYLALVHHQLGHDKEARQKLEEFRHRVSGEELEALLREVETALNLVALGQNHGPIKSVAFSPDGKTVLLGGGYGNLGQVELWDVAGRQKKLNLEGHPSQVYAVAFAPDGKTVASCGQDKTVRLWNVADGKALRTLEGHTGAVNGVAFSPGGENPRAIGKLLASAGDDRVRVWEAETGKEVRTLDGHKGGVLAVAYSPDGKRLASAGADKTVRVWDADQGTELFSCQGVDEPVAAVVWSPDGKRLAAAGKVKTVRAWDAVEGKEVFTLKLTTPGPHVVAWRPDGKRLAVSYRDKETDSTAIALHETEGGKEVGKLPTQRFWAECVAFSPDGRWLLTTPGGNTVILQDLGRLKK
jgi:WD40 repeat protein